MSIFQDLKGAFNSNDNALIHCLKAYMLTVGNKEWQVIRVHALPSNGSTLYTLQ
jgi:hypothetical protein